MTKAKDNLINDNNNVLQKMKRYFDIIDDDSEVLQYFKSIGIKIDNPMFFVCGRNNYSS